MLMQWIKRIADGTGVLADVSAADPMPVGVQPRACLLHRGITVTSTSTTLAALWAASNPGEPMPSGALVARIQPRGGSVCMRFDGSAVTASTGEWVPDGTPIELQQSTFAVVTLIRSGSADVPCTVSLWDRP